MTSMGTSTDDLQRFIAEIYLKSPVLGNFEAKLLSYLDASHRELLDAIKNTGEINDDTNTKLLKAIEDFKSGYKN